MPRPVKPTLSFDDRLAQEAKRLRDQASALKPGLEPERLLRRTQQVETASHVNDWLSSPGCSHRRRSSRRCLGLNARRVIFK